MTPELDPNQRIARLMGLKVVNGTGIFFGQQIVKTWEGPDDPYLIDDESRFDNALESTYALPDYFSPDLPIGERLKMWEKLTEEQKIQLIYEIFGPRLETRMAHILKLVEAVLSPEFPSTFLRVVEGKG